MGERALSVGERVIELEKNFTALSMSVASLGSEVSKIRKTVNRHAGLLGLVDEHRAAKTLDRIEHRINELSDLLQVEILKQTVCSEVSRVYPDVWPKIVRALDQPNEWWRKGESLTISAWRDRLQSSATVQ